MTKVASTWKLNGTAYLPRLSKRGFAKPTRSLQERNDVAYYGENAMRLYGECQCVAMVSGWEFEKFGTLEICIT